MDSMELILLYDYYGALLTDRQKECFEMRYHQDLSLGEIGEELGISRQGVHDNLSRTESMLRNMEQKTGCMRRDLAYRKATRLITESAKKLVANEDKDVSALGSRILSAIEGLGE